MFSPFEWFKLNKIVFYEYIYRFYVENWQKVLFFWSEKYKQFYFLGAFPNSTLDMWRYWTALSLLATGLIMIMMIWSTIINLNMSTNKLEAPLLLNSEVVNLQFWTFFFLWVELSDYFFLNSTSLTEIKKNQRYQSLQLWIRKSSGIAKKWRWRSNSLMRPSSAAEALVVGRQHRRLLQPPLCSSWGCYVCSASKSPPTVHPTPNCCRWL